MAHTGVAAINIDGTTINTVLAIPKETGDNVPPMSDQKKTQMRMSLWELKLIIIDEISMVGNTTLLHIHQRLKEIFGASNSELFVGIIILVIGDMYHQFVRNQFLLTSRMTCLTCTTHGTMIELVDIMRQKDDQPLAQLLNRFCTVCQTEDYIKCIQSRALPV